MISLETALAYIRRGWNPVPIPHRAKAPIGDDWQHRRIDEASAPRFFNGAAMNVGVQLGAASAGLTDVDLDCPEALALAPYLLPKTKAIFGRRGKSSSHRLYVTTLAETLDKGAVRLRDPTTRATLVELRVGGGDKGAQTVFPGSTHESGEPIEWEQNGEPAKVDGANLRRAVEALAAGCLLVRAWPAKGGRHDAALVVGGVLARAGWTVTEARQFMGAVVQAAGCENVEAKQDAAESAVKGLAEGATVYGFPALVEFLGEKTALKPAEWIGFKCDDPIGRMNERARRAAEENPYETFDEDLNLDGDAATIVATPFIWTDPTAIPPRRFVYGRHLIRQFVSTTIAPGGVGKSSLGIVEALAMASGKPLLGVQPEGRLRVWLWNGEDPVEELQRRIMAAAKHYGLAREDIEGHLFADSGRRIPIVIAEQTRDGAKVAVPVVEAVTRTIREIRIDVMTVDPFAASHRVTENDNNAIERVAKTWAGIADATNSAIDLVHHARKTGGAEVTVEDGRGAVTLLGAARSARVLNAMTEEEAARAGVEERRVHFRVDNGKANLAPPEATAWFKLISVNLGNGPKPSLSDALGVIDVIDHPTGDNVGVVTAWAWPDPLADVTTDDLRAAQKAVAEGGPWRENCQANDWVGKPIAAALKLDPGNKAHARKITGLLKIWIETGMFVRVAGRDPKRRDARIFVEAGNGQRTDCTTS